MPSNNVHRTVGVGAGAATALYQRRIQDPVNQLLEGIGGAAGGLVGGMLPDVLEPAINSWHRNVAHSWAAGGARAGCSNRDPGDVSLLDRVS